MNLNPIIVEELRSTYDRLDSEGKLLSNAQLDAAYQAFRDRFSPEKLQALEGEELLLRMHSRGDSSSLVYWLEFKDDEEFPSRRMGSISGGSAHKFGVFYRQDKSAWINGSPQKSQEVTLAEAIDIARKQRNELIAGTQILANLPLNGNQQVYADLQKQMSLVAPNVSDSAWGHKYFSLLFPDKLDDYHNPDYQRNHLIRLLQPPPEGNGRYICGGMFVEMAQDFNLRMNSLTAVLNERNGHSPYHYWRVGTREGDQGVSQWKNMLEGGYVAIGWDGIGDLSAIRSIPENAQRKTAIKQLLALHLADRYPSEGSAGAAAGEIHRFLVDISEGDLVLAADGAKVVGVGRVTGPYYYASEGRFRHRRPMDWLSQEAWPMPEREQLMSTVRPLVKPVNLLEAERRIFGAQPPSLTFPERLTSTPAPPLGDIPERIGNILGRKGQVIIYGPPGTGKTHWAEIAARELAARSWFHKAFDQLSSSEQAEIWGTELQPGGAVRMCSFHPAYGYEDFLEGYRPGNVDGQMVFQLRDGIFKRLCRDAAAQPDRDFFLIIDEINRGDIPRIFGELLTVMERNKRGKTVLLPLTGTPFHVPPNVLTIGTMNTADRSIALLDAALRRRFGFLELMPDSQVFGQVNLGTLPLRQWFEALNASVVQHVGRDGRNLQIGHSYLLTDNGHPISEITNFARVLAEDIIPLLQEYCYEDYAILERILGSGLIDTGKQRIRAELFSSDRGDDLIQALLAHHPELSTYVAVPESEETEEDKEEQIGSPEQAGVVFGASVNSPVALEHGG